VKRLGAPGAFLYFVPPTFGLLFLTMISPLLSGRSAPCVFPPKQLGKRVYGENLCWVSLFLFWLVDMIGYLICDIRFGLVWFDLICFTLLLAGLKERDQRQGVDDDADCSCISQMAFLTTRWSESSTRRLLKNTVHWEGLCHL
jgi:hypothetical protein